MVDMEMARNSFHKKNERTNSNFSNSYYSIIGSKTLKPNSVFAVAVSLHDSLASSFVKLTIQNEKNFKLTNTVLVPQRSSKVVQFSVSLE